MGWRGSKSYTPPFLIFFVQTFAFPPSNFLGIIIRVVSFRSFTLFVYARFLRLRLIVVGVVVLRDVLLIHYFITLVLNYRRTLPTLFYIISDLPSPPESFFFFFFEREKMRNQTCAVLPSPCVIFSLTATGHHARTKTSTRLTTRDDDGLSLMMRSTAAECGVVVSPTKSTTLWRWSV